MGENLMIGSGLTDLLTAQAEEDRAVSYPLLHSHAEALGGLCAELGDPLVWPIGEAGNRIAGASTLLSHGRVKVAGTSTDLAGHVVLLVAGVLCTPLPLAHGADVVRRLGAADVHGCAVRVSGLGDGNHTTLSSLRHLTESTHFVFAHSAS